MAIDTALKRRSISGIPFLLPGVTPDATPGEEWRASVAWGYYEISIPGVFSGETAVFVAFRDKRLYAEFRDKRVYAAFRDTRVEAEFRDKRVPVKFRDKRIL